MKLFKPKYRVIEVSSGYIAQVRASRIWRGITAELCTWTCADSQLKYCTASTKEEAQNTMNSYKAITE